MPFLLMMILMLHQTLISKDKVNEVAIGKKGSETAGYVVTVTDSDGYGGDIKFTVGISTDGKVLEYHSFQSAKLLVLV